MKWITRLYRFLGSAAFAIILIALSTILVTIGTFIESNTGSHRYAASYTYGSDYFSLVLAGFFINILVSALRRWPFKRKHIPFLITHLGLLMVIGGVLIKQYAGVQGNMFLVEGAATDQLMLPDTLALRIDKPGERPVFALLSALEENINNENGGWQVIHTFPHASEKFDSFIKHDWVVVNGVSPFPLKQFISADLKGFTWALYGEKNVHVHEKIKEQYIQRAALRIFDPLTGEDLCQMPLADALQTKIALNQQILTVEFLAGEDAHGSVEDPYLELTLGNRKLRLPLQNEKVVFSLLDDPALGYFGFDAEVTAIPTIFFLEDKQENLFIIVFGPRGDISTARFGEGQLGNLYSYDNGFGGYSTQTKFLIRKRTSFEEDFFLTQSIQQQLNEAEPSQLAPPLQMLKKACQESSLDFSAICVEFLSAWHKTGQWLFTPQALSSSLHSALSSLDWSKLSESDWKGCFWTDFLLESLLKKGDGPFLEKLSASGWPFLGEIEKLPLDRLESDIFHVFTHQVFRIAEELPPVAREANHRADRSAILLSCLCRLHGIHLSSVLSAYEGDHTEICLECPLSTSHHALEPSHKMEDNRPLLFLCKKNSLKHQGLALGYSKDAQGLRWPAPDGKSMLRFQPAFITLPYEVRLRRATQITYPHSTQPYSYECDLFIKDKKTGLVEEVALSMNNVYETQDGYRLYLAGMSPADESCCKKVQLVVNRDPAKYLLTYPGGLILTLGITLLFWLRAYL